MDATHVRVMNLKSGLPQIVKKSTWQMMNTQNPKSAKGLEYLYDCNEKGEKVYEEKIEDIKIMSESETKETFKPINNGGEQTTTGGKKANTGGAGSGKKPDNKESEKAKRVKKQLDSNSEFTSKEPK